MHIILFIISIKLFSASRFKYINFKLKTKVLSYFSLIPYNNFKKLRLKVRVTHDSNFIRTINRDKKLNRCLALAKSHILILKSV